MIDKKILKGKGEGKYTYYELVQRATTVQLACNIYTQELKVKNTNTKRDKTKEHTKMLSEEVAKKIKEDLSSFFGNSLSSIILYDSYAKGKETQ